MLYGLGAIGTRVAKAVYGRHDLHVVGAIDSDPAKAGRDVGDLIGQEPAGIRVSKHPASVLRDSGAEVVVHTTRSYFAEVYDQLAEVVRAGVNVVSSTEELAYPWLRTPELADTLHRLSMEYGVSVVGTGVNPGFAMDLLPLMLTGVCREIRKVEVTRVLDATKRRGPLQQKIGSGMTPEAFERLAIAGNIGHVGLVESAALIAKGLGIRLDNIRETLVPVIAERSIRTDYVTVETGQVAGIRHRAVGLLNGEEVIVLDLEMSLGAEHVRDAVRINATPPIDMVVTNGIHGDEATVNALLNAVPRIVEARPGLLTGDELSLPKGTIGVS
jgi:4-hydroxy-tetrahydrodipicolinate reductase